VIVSYILSRAKDKCVQWTCTEKVESFSCKQGTFHGQAEAVYSRQEQFTQDFKGEVIRLGSGLIDHNQNITIAAM
jgi:hypothetical protein